MSVMSEIDLQCAEAMEAIETAIDHMGFEEGDAVPAMVAVMVTTEAAHLLTPINAWECTLPHLLRWAYEKFEVVAPTLH